MGNDEIRFELTVYDGTDVIHKASTSATREYMLSDEEKVTDALIAILSRHAKSKIRYAHE